MIGNSTAFFAWLDPEVAKEMIGEDPCLENTPDLLALTSLIESGQVRPVIDRTYPLSQTPAAIQCMRDGHARGKVVISL